MKNRVEEFNNEVNEFMDDVAKNCFNISTIANMGLEELSALRKAIKLMKLAEELLVEQAEMFDDMNSKLDKIIYLIGESKLVRELESK